MMLPNEPQLENLTWQMGGETFKTCPSIPDVITIDWVRELSRNLEKATWHGPKGIAAIFPPTMIINLLTKVLKSLMKEPTLVEVTPTESTHVIVVGDTHGQYHDILKMFEVAGEPSPERHYIFNGDFVDRGAWGLEVLLVFIAWKLALPNHVTLLRGNHETTTCTTMYGFKTELDRNFGNKAAKPVYQMCKKVFLNLPLAARVHGKTLILHGGLFRRPVNPLTKNKRKRKYAATATCDLGHLEDLRSASKGGLDPNGRGSTLIATDVLWSDPVLTEGLQANDQRGIGAVFGPDVTQRFLRENGLKLILRSHEGPDARIGRDDLAGMDNGWTLDHDTPEGKLYTVFSAPDYPQFQPEDEERIGNKAAVAVLRAPSWCEPEMILFEAVLPRPDATACYNFAEVPGSDEEMEIAGDQSEGSHISRSQASGSQQEDFTSNEAQEIVSSRQTENEPHLQNGTSQAEANSDVEMAEPDWISSKEAENLSHRIDEGIDPVEPPASGFRRSRRLSLNSANREKQLPPSSQTSKSKKAKPVRKSQAKIQTSEIQADAEQNLPEALPPVENIPRERDLAFQDAEPISAANGLVENQNPNLQPAKIESPQDLKPIPEKASNEASGREFCPGEETKMEVDLPEQNLGRSNPNLEAIANEPNQNIDSLRDPYDFPENSQELNASNLEQTQEKTPESIPPLFQIANPGRELEQAAAKTLANIGGLQNFSDTPEPLYLQSQSQPLHSQPSQKDQEATTPKFGPSPPKTFNGKENEAANGNTGIQLPEESDVHQKIIQDTALLHNGHTDSKASEKQVKAKIPWR